MQKFALLHNGTTQGWQATYLAFHIANRLGAPLLVLIDAHSDKGALTERATHVEIGGRAARVATETRIIKDFSADTLKENITAVDGLFLPQRLITDKDTASLFLEAFSCPLWVVLRDDDKPNSMAVLVQDPLQDIQLITYAHTLSQRLQRSLTALIADDRFESILKLELTKLKWTSLKTVSASQVNQTLEKLKADLLLLSGRSISIVKELTVNYVICPNGNDA